MANLGDSHQPTHPWSRPSLLIQVRLAEDKNIEIHDFFMVLIMPLDGLEQESETADLSFSLVIYEQAETRS